MPRAPHTQTIEPKIPFTLSHCVIGNADFYLLKSEMGLIQFNEQPFDVSKSVMHFLPAAPFLISESARIFLGLHTHTLRANVRCAKKCVREHKKWIREEFKERQPRALDGQRVAFSASVMELISLELRSFLTQ